MTILKKSIDQNYTQGTPGVPATPGSSARKAYTSYEPGWGWSYTQVAVAEPPGWWQVNYSSGSFVDYIFDALTYDDLGNAATGTWYRVQATWEPIIVPVYHPATAAVAPTPGIPATAASFVTDYRIGWNAGARSVKAIGGDGRLAFKAPASSRGVVAGLNEADTGTSIAEIDHAFYISAGKYKVVEQGYAPGQNGLATLYSYGRGVTRDDKQSVVWYRKAAEQGYERAQYNLGAAYFNGLGVAKDYRQAALWTEKSAEQGNIYAMYNLALSYSRGQGVEKDLVQSHKWFSLAAASGDKPAAKKRDELETQMTPEQIRQAQALAKEWKPRCK